MKLDLKSRNRIKDLMKMDKATATQQGLADRMVEIAREKNDNSFKYSRSQIKKLLNENEDGYISDLAFHYLAMALDTTQDYILFKDEYLNEEQRKRILGFTKEELNEDLTAWKDSIRKKNQTLDVVKKVLDALELDPEVLGVHRKRKYSHKEVNLHGTDLDSNKSVIYKTSYEEAKQIVEEQGENPKNIVYSEKTEEYTQFEKTAIKIKIQPDPEDAEREYCIPIESIMDVYNSIMDAITNVIAEKGISEEQAEYSICLDGLEAENKPLPEHWQKLLKKYNESHSEQ